jgi:hypothetical protein
MLYNTATKEAEERKRAYHRAYYAAHKEHSAAYHREYSKANSEKIIAYVREWEEKHPGITVKYVKQHCERHPDRAKARRAVREAIRKGTLTRNPCEVCNSIKAESHHPDYSKPLEVRWLCKFHHIHLEES